MEEKPIRIVTLEPAYFAALEHLQQECYPTLSPVELMRHEQYASQYEVFPEGQFVALDGEHVIGQGSGFLTDFDFDDPEHTFREFTDHFFFRNHVAQSDWYYGADISVHPGWRGRGVGKLLYVARQNLVRKLGRKGIVAGGMLPGYPAHREKYTPAEYAARVAEGRLYDPTLSFQLHMGFRLRGMIRNYMEDSATGNWSTLIVWENDQLTEQPWMDSQAN